MANTFNIYRLLSILYKLQDNKHYDYLKLVKLYYFAEKHHLRTYGLLMNNDDFYAMEFGTVASSVKDILSKNFGFLKNINNDIAEFLNTNILFDKDNNYCDIHQQNTDILSKAVINSIEFTLEHFSKFKQFMLSDISHDYIEWQKHEQTLKGGRLSVLEDIEDFFIDPELNNSKYIKQYLSYDPYKVDSDYTKYVYSNYLDNKKIDNFMNQHTFGNA